MNKILRNVCVVLLSCWGLTAHAKNETIECPGAINEAKAECKARCEKKNGKKNPTTSASKLAKLEEKQKDLDAKIKAAEDIVNSPTQSAANKDKAKEDKAKYVTELAKVMADIALATDGAGACDGTNDCGALTGKIAKCASGEKKKITFKVLHPDAKWVEDTATGSGPDPVNCTLNPSDPSCGPTTPSGPEAGLGCAATEPKLVCVEVKCPLDKPDGLSTVDEIQRNTSAWESAQGECGRRCRDISQGAEACLTMDQKCGPLGEKLTKCASGQIKSFGTSLANDNLSNWD